MSDDILSNPLVQQAFRLGRRSLGVDKFYAVLGDKNGRVAEGLPPNKVRVRKVNADGLYGKEYIVTAWTHETTNYMMYAGTPVIVGYVLGELAILGQYAQATEAIGINPSVLNIGNPFTQSTQTTELLPLLCHAVGTTTTPSTKIGIKSFRYYDMQNQVRWYRASVATQVDLASHIPSAGQHRYVVIFFDTLNEVFVVKTSASQSMVIPLDDTDKQECFDSMPPYSIPIAMWRLRDAQTSVTQADFVEDLRPLWGRGTARQRVTATTNPTSADDKNKGYGVGSVWVNTSTDAVFICADDAVGGAVWQNVSGAGMTSFTVAGMTGTPQTISDGNTLTIEGVNYVKTEAQATDKVVVKYIASPLHIMGW